MSDIQNMTPAEVIAANTPFFRAVALRMVPHLAAGETIELAARHAMEDELAFEQEMAQGVTDRARQLPGILARHLYETIRTTQRR